MVVDLFKFNRCQHPERAVAAVAVVKDLEVVEQGGAELDSRLPFLAVEQLGLQPGPEGLDERVVVGVSDGPLKARGRRGGRVR